MMIWNLKARRRCLFGIIALMLVLLPACSPRAGRRVAAPGISGDTATLIIKEFDKDGDGSLTAKELPHGFTFELFDMDTNGTITAEEMASVIETWQSMKVGLSAFNLKFLFNGQPLEGATVTLEPYSFQGTEILPASGVSNLDGVVDFSVAEGSLPAADMKLMHCGLYRMRVSKQSGGKEVLPKKYNSESILGCAALPNGRIGEVIKL